jgi:hypothetical protein
MRYYWILLRHKEHYIETVSDIHPFEYQKAVRERDGKNYILMNWRTIDAEAYNMWNSINE